MRASEYDRPIRSLDAYLSALSKLVALTEPVQDWNRSKWFKRPSASDADFNRCWAEVSQAAGPAAMAFEIAGMAIDHKPPGTVRTTRVNPALLWPRCFGDDAVSEPSLIFTVGMQAMGHLKALREEQAEREHGFVGAIAWFFTLAPRIREAAGLSRNSASGTAVAGATVFIQGVLIAAIGGALVFPLAHWLGWSP